MSDDATMVAEFNALENIITAARNGMADDNIPEWQTVRDALIRNNGPASCFIESTDLPPWQMFARVIRSKEAHLPLLSLMYAAAIEQEKIRPPQQRRNAFDQKRADDEYEAERRAWMLMGPYAASMSLTKAIMHCSQFEFGVRATSVLDAMHFALDKSSVANIDPIVCTFWWASHYQNNLGGSDEWMKAVMRAMQMVAAAHRPVEFSMLATMWPRIVSPERRMYWIDHALDFIGMASGCAEIVDQAVKTFRSDPENDEISLTDNWIDDEIRVIGLDNAEDAAKFREFLRGNKLTRKKLCMLSFAALEKVGMTLDSTFKIYRAIKARADHIPRSKYM